MTVGLQGGGSIYTPEVYDHYVNSAFECDGSLKSAYFDRLRRVLEAADVAGMVVIVNCFYWKQAQGLEGERAIRRATEGATDWLLSTGHRNVLVDVMNEVKDWEGVDPVLTPSGIHQLIQLVQRTALHGRCLLVGSSTLGGARLPTGRW